MIELKGFFGFLKRSISCGCTPAQFYTALGENRGENLRNSRQNEVGKRFAAFLCTWYCDAATMSPRH